MTALKPYAEYTGPSTDWLGKVPAHWELASLRQVCGIAGGMTPPKSRPDYWIGDVPWVSPKDMKRFRIAGAIDSISHEAVKHTGMTLLPVGSVLVVVRGMILARRVPVAVTESPLTINQDMKALIPAPRLIPDYLARVLSAGQDALFPLIDEAGHGTRRLPTPLLMSVLIPVPPLAEQRAIADFLDVMDARISRFIAAKRRMIALLEEKKQAVINQAVTRGLDPDVPLKDSGVDWLGEIPAHWDVRRMKDFLREVDERSESGTEELLSVSHLTGVTPRSEKNITMFKAESYVGHKLSRPGDVVANTMWLWMGAIGIAGHTGIVSPSYAVYRRTSDLVALSDYLDLLLRTRPYVGEYHRQSTGIRSSRLRLYPDQFLRMKVALPDLAEQHRILKRIEEDIARVSAVWDRSRREIELIQEYRTRLITDVVTGKVDVRGVD